MVPGSSPGGTSLRSCRTSPDYSGLRLRYGVRGCAKRCFAIAAPHRNRSPGEAQRNPGWHVQPRVTAFGLHPGYQSSNTPAANYQTSTRGGPHRTAPASANDTPSRLLGWRTLWRLRIGADVDPVLGITPMRLAPPLDLPKPSLPLLLAATPTHSGAATPHAGHVTSSRRRTIGRSLAVGRCIGPRLALLRRWRIGPIGRWRRHVLEATRTEPEGTCRYWKTPCRNSCSKNNDLERFHCEHLIVNAVRQI